MQFSYNLSHIGYAWFSRTGDKLMTATSFERVSNPKTNPNVPAASLFYSDDYSIHLSTNDLRLVEQSVYSTHTSKWAETARAISQFLLLPWRKSLQLIGHAIEPSPGANKQSFSLLKTRPLRFLTACFGVAFFLVSVVLALALFPFHLAALIAYKKRPVMSFLNNAAKEDVPANFDLSHEKPLHVRTHNIGFVLESMGIVGDLRPVKRRAHELVDFILNDQAQPDVICFQEAFHEDGTRILCEGIKTKYPYIITNVLPTASGFNSGAMIASKYPILDTSFHCLKHNIGVERLAPKGVLRVKIDTNKGPVNIYDVHTQALIGKERSEARDKQLQQIKQIMEVDFEKDNVPQILMGDLNTSEIDAWGNSNTIDPNNPEVAVQNRLHNEFDDLFLKDHHRDGARTDGSKSHFLAIDNKRMDLDDPLTEARATWYAGLFPKNTLVGAGVHAKMEQDRKKHNYTVKPVVQTETKPSWGTGQWRNNQPANTARFDYILFPKYKGVTHQLDGCAEIRRVYVPVGQESATTDHLPVDALIWHKQSSISI